MKKTSTITMTGVDNWNLKPGDSVDVGNGRIVTIVTVRPGGEFTVKRASWLTYLQWRVSDWWFFFKLDVARWWRRWTQ